MNQCSFFMTKETYDAMMEEGRKKMKTCKYIDKKGFCQRFKKTNSKVTENICMICGEYENVSKSK